MARVQMPQFVWIPVPAGCPNPTRSDITAGKQRIVIDEPTSRHGNDEGMLPLQALMASLASCTLVVANQIASELGIVFRDSHNAMTGTFDTRCYTGEAKAVSYTHLTLPTIYSV